MMDSGPVKRPRIEEYNPAKELPRKYSSFCTFVSGDPGNDSTYFFHHINTTLEMQTRLVYFRGGQQYEHTEVWKYYFCRWMGDRMAILWRYGRSRSVASARNNLRSVLRSCTWHASSATTPQTIFDETQVDLAFGTVRPFDYLTLAKLGWLDKSPVSWTLSTEDSSDEDAEATVCDMPVESAVVLALNGRHFQEVVDSPAVTKSRCNASSSSLAIRMNDALACGPSCSLPKPVMQNVGLWLDAQDDFEDAEAAEVTNRAITALISIVGELRMLRRDPSCLLQENGLQKLEDLVSELSEACAHPQAKLFEVQRMATLNAPVVVGVLEALDSAAAHLSETTQVTLAQEAAALVDLVEEETVDLACEAVALVGKKRMCTIAPEQAGLMNMHLNWLDRNTDVLRQVLRQVSLQQQRPAAPPLPTPSLSYESAGPEHGTLELYTPKLSHGERVQLHILCARDLPITHIDDIIYLAKLTMSFRERNIDKCATLTSSYTVWRDAMAVLTRGVELPATFSGLPKALESKIRNLEKGLFCEREGCGRICREIFKERWCKKNNKRTYVPGEKILAPVQKQFCSPRCRYDYEIENFECLLCGNNRSELIKTVNPAALAAWSHTSCDEDDVSLLWIEVTRCANNKCRAHFGVGRRDE